MLEKINKTEDMKSKGCLGNHVNSLVILAESIEQLEKMFQGWFPSY